jgi:DNA-binding NarL/FixJ family response regulator
MGAAGIQERVPATADQGGAIRVLVGEDNYFARAGIEHALEKLEGVVRVETCGELDILREHVAAWHPDVVLTKVRMPPSHADEGLRFAADLRDSNPDIGVIILSQYADPEYATALFASGTSRRGYLLTEHVDDRQLGMALREVAAGRAYVDPALVEAFLADRPSDGSSLDSLTPRELAILALVADGCSNVAIAGAAGVSIRAVERNTSSIFAKLGLHDRKAANARVTATRIYLAAADTTGA